MTEEPDHLQIKIRRSQSRKRNIMARILRDQGDHKGAFHIKIRDARKGEYKRIGVKDILNDYENED